jgi:vacuolar-type H+-ATPase subunit H
VGPLVQAPVPQVEEKNRQDQEDLEIEQAEQIFSNANKKAAELALTHGSAAQVTKEELIRAQRFYKELEVFRDRILRERQKRVAAIQAAANKKSGWWWGGRKTGRKRRLTRHRRSRRR